MHRDDELERAYPGFRFEICVGNWNFAIQYVGVQTIRGMSAQALMVAFDCELLYDCKSVWVYEMH